METVTHSLFFLMVDISAGGQAIVLKHFSLSLVLLNLKWTKSKATGLKNEIELLSKIGK